MNKVWCLLPLWCLVACQDHRGAPAVPSPATATRPVVSFSLSPADRQTSVPQQAVRTITVHMQAERDIHDVACVRAIDALNLLTQVSTTFTDARHGQTTMLFNPRLPPGDYRSTLTVIAYSDPACVHGVLGQAQGLSVHPVVRHDTQPGSPRP